MRLVAVCYSAVLSVLVSFSSALAIDLANLKGETRTEHLSPYGVRELCVVPKKWPGAAYRSEDTGKESTLCGYDFYRFVGICPKYNSTNPGVLLLAPNAKYDKEAIDASDCNVKKMGVKTEAKFKQTITCSYTPSILAYYHMSRILGGVGRVPVAVIRTMDLNVHNQLTTKAVHALRDSTDTIAEGWRKLGQMHLNPGAFPQLVDSTLTQLYGGLSDNVKNEEIYYDVSGRGSYNSRYQRFLKQKPFLKVASSKTVAQLVGSTEFTRVAQDVIQMKDVADMVLIDTLMNQQDRIGNIHYKFYWYSINPSTHRIERSKSDAELVEGQIVVPAEEKRQMAGRPAVVLKEMVLKDNDCGVIKDNMMRAFSVLEKVRHMSYLTYRYFMAFEKSLAHPATKDYFKTEMLFTDKDYRSLQDNARKAKEILTGTCRTGQLKFDLDLETYLPGARPPVTPCNI